MAVKNFSFKVDFITKNSLCMAHVKQNDNAIFNIYLTQQGQALDLTGQQVRLFVRKPDGKLVVQEKDITVVDAKGGAIKVNVQNSIFQAVGVAVCEIDLWGNDKNNASSGSFLINIDEQLGNNDVVESHVDVNLFRQLSEYIDEANAEILKYKTLFEAFVEAGVSLKGLNDIKAYIDNNLADLKAQGDRAVDLIPKVNKASTDAEAKRVEVVKVTATADASKNNLITATTNADNKKKEVEGATANAEAKRKGVVAVTETANTSKGQLETATANADKKKAEIITATADAEKKRAEVVKATSYGNTANSKLNETIPIASGINEELQSTMNYAHKISSDLSNAKADADKSKKELDASINTANTKKTEVDTATNNAEQKRLQLVAVTNTAEAKRQELQKVVDSVGGADLVTVGQMNSALANKLDKNGQIRTHYDLVYDNTKACCNTSQIGIQSGNNGLGIGLESTFNSRNGWVQVGHGDDNYANSYGTLRLNPKGGDVWINNNLAMSAKSTGEYYGLCVGADDGSWIRTPQTGLIPYTSGINSSLGTEAWKFADAWIDRLHGRRIELTEYGKTLTMGGSSNDCFLVNSKANRYLQLKDDGRLCYGDSQVAYGNYEVVYNNGTGEMTEGRLHLGGNMWLFWGWFNVNLPEAGAVSRDYTVPACKRIHYVSVSCYSKNAEFTYGELGVLSIWSTGFKTRLYNSRSGGQHCISYQVIGTI